MDPFVANDLRGDPRALRERIDEDGYLFVRRLLDPQEVGRIRMSALELCREAGLLKPGASLDEALPAVRRSEVTGPTLAALSRQLFGLEAVHVLFHSPAVTDFMQKLIGETVVPHVHKQVRV